MPVKSKELAVRSRKLGSGNGSLRTDSTHFFEIVSLLTENSVCQSDLELECETLLVIQRIINEVTGNVIFDLAGFWVFIDLAGKITHDVNRKARNQ